jgi:hypothetical protein
MSEFSLEDIATFLSTDYRVVLRTAKRIGTRIPLVSYRPKRYGKLTPEDARKIILEHYRRKGERIVGK